jgi:predicted DNA-binding transcriptional regulator YafY
MPTNKNAAIRYKVLDKCFRNFHRRYFIEDLMEECDEALVSFNFEGDVSRRQIFDDIRFMESEAGWNVPLERKHDGKRVYYRYERDDFSISEQILTDEEAQQLKTAIVTLSRFRGLPSEEWVDEVISTLEWRFNLRRDKEDIISFGQNPYLRGLNHLPTLIDAASEHRVLRVTYRSYRNGSHATTAVFHPYHLKQYNNRWFALGLDGGRGYLTNYALDRIEALEEADDVRYVPNRDTDFEHYFDDVVGVTIPDRSVTKETIVLRLSAERYPYVVSKPLHASQRIVNEADHTISIEVRPTPELEQQIFSFGSDVEVVAPESYRAKIAKKVKESMQKYFGEQDG